jgi:hypothetical protein
MAIQAKTRNKIRDWSAKSRFRVNEVCKHNGNIYQNTSGRNISEPTNTGSGDWELIRQSSSGSGIDSVTNHSVYDGVNNVFQLDSDVICPVLVVANQSPIYAWNFDNGTKEVTITDTGLIFENDDIYITSLKPA